MTPSRFFVSIRSAVVAIACVSASCAAADKATPSPDAKAKTPAATRPATRPTTQPGFESHVSAYEAADRKAAPAKGGIVFYGSSSIRLWKTLEQDLPGLPVLNRGFGGSSAPDALKYMDRICLPYEPKTIVWYEGDNDLAKGRSPEQYAADCKTFAERVHAKLPDSRILFLAIKPSPSRVKHFDNQKKANQLLSDWIKASGDKRLAYVDIATPMLDAAGNARPELFVADKLHMNHDGYKIWTDVLLPYLK